MRVPAAGADRKFAVFGGVEYFSGKVVWHISPRKNSNEFRAFLERLADAFPQEPVVVVLDNVGYHKSRQSRMWWESQRNRIRPFWLPVYTPHLNLMERVWREVKDKISCHRWWSDLDSLESAVNALLGSLGINFNHYQGPSFSMAQNFRRSA